MNKLNPLPRVAELLSGKAEFEHRLSGSRMLILNHYTSLPSQAGRGGLDLRTTSAWITPPDDKAIKDDRLPCQHGLEARVQVADAQLSSIESLNFLKGWRHLECWPLGQSLQFIPISPCSSSPAEEANSSCSCTLPGPPVQSGHLGDPCPPGTRVASVWPHPGLTAGVALIQTAGTESDRVLSPVLPYKWGRESRPLLFSHGLREGQVPGIK